MEFIIETDDEEAKKKIQEELEVFCLVIEAAEGVLEKPINIIKIIIPQDFEQKINELENSSDYKAIRGVEGSQIPVAAKCVRNGDTHTIVLSPIIYFIYDYKVRLFIFTHEVAHVLYKIKNPSISNEQTAKFEYLRFLKQIFEEYFSDRFSYQMTDRLFPEFTEYWEKFLSEENDGYLASPYDDKNFNFIKQKIEEFRNHGNLPLFVSETREVVEIILFSISHGFSKYHQYKDKFDGKEFVMRNFVNSEMFELADFLKTLYEDKSIKLEGGLEQVKNYLATLGIKFEDTPQGLYCHVLDI